ncbi:hypothetical protein BS17DRAFT_297518 [Gyrodon lividus]|nr:hypothetical protein BS17DRAFT_297518 [Gyrodon lividus]
MWCGATGRSGSGNNSDKDVNGDDENRDYGLLTPPRSQIADNDNDTDGWSDSEDEFSLTGEYTGKFKVLTVPTKADPPTRGTRTSWGRPVSPFPYSEIMERSLPLEDFTEEEGIAALDDFDGHDASWDAHSLPPSDDPELGDLATEPPSSDEPWLSSSEYDEYDEDLPVFEAVLAAAESTVVRPLVLPSEPRPVSDQTVVLQEEEEEEEAEVDRELSVPVDDGLDIPITLPARVDEAEEDGSSDDDEDVQSDIVKITSGDAVAAARAAAILRMHDYDCVLAAAGFKRSSRSVDSSRKRRTTIVNAGIAKSYTDPKQQRRQTIHGNELSCNDPFLELWRNAEDSVFLEHHTPGKTYCDASFALSPHRVSTSRPQSGSASWSGEWTREDWKCMDKCLVAERLAVAAASGRHLLADIQDISRDAVLERFITAVGGDPLLLGLRPEWSRDDLMMRLNVLIKKQLRFETKPPSFHRKECTVPLDSTVPRYRNLLQEAFAVSSTADLVSTSSDPSLSFTQQDLRNRSFPEPLPCLQPGWSSQCRGPIVTPSRPAEPRPQHPKDQVHLRHASLPKKSKIPVLVRPRRLVDLRHLSPCKLNREASLKILQPRGSSGCSVKELVKCFQDSMD